ncbi:GroES-like protein [Naviculisporaceae sp. PSN 640]
MATSVQYQLTNKNGPFTLVTIPKPIPQASEICIRTKAIALNPLDFKARLFGAAIESWPAVLGIDMAGIVESVGANVTNFKPGDEVFSLAGTTNRAGAFQEIVTVPEHFVTKKPTTLTFEEAATLPIVFLTASAVVGHGLGASLFAPVDDDVAAGYKSVLVVGGSSGVGASAIQILRLALPDIKIFATAAGQYTEHLKSLGADQVFEKSAQDDPAKIIAASPGGKGVDAIIDAVGAAAKQGAILKALSPEGKKVYSQVFTNPGGDVKEVPGVEGSNISLSFGRQAFGLPGGMQAIETLTRLVEEGKWKRPKRVEVIGEGWDAIPAGLKRVMNGAGGSKLVVKI